MTAFASPISRPSVDLALRRLPERIAHAVWRGSDLAGTGQPALSTGFAALDAALPDGGWPTRCVSEILLAPTAWCEWRLLGPALPALLAKRNARIYLIAPPQTPQAMGLAQLGLPAGQLLWIDAHNPADRLWATEQIIQSDPAGAVLAWITSARADQIRRLQVHAQVCGAPVFLFRAQAQLHQSSAAPLRVSVAPAAGWQLEVRIHKRRGAILQEVLHLDAIPRNLQTVLPPRLRDLAQPAAVPRPRSTALMQEEARHALGCTLTSATACRRIAH